MTVEELIKELGKYDGKAEVLYYCSRTEHYTPLEVVHKEKDGVKLV